MAVAAQPPRPASSVGRSWPSPDELRELTPLLRLITAVWAIPAVTKLGVSSDGGEGTVWVFMAEEDLGAESRISVAEREYINASPDLSFSLQVVPLSDVSETALPPYDTIIER